MKYTQQDYNELKTAVITAISKTGQTLSDIELEYKRDHLTFTRFIWDLYWVGKKHLPDPYAHNDYLDAHVETAMKRIYTELID